MRSSTDRGASRFVEEHPLLAYCVVSFAISWGVIVVLLASGVVVPDAEHLVLLLGLGYVGMLAGPSIAAVSLRAVLEGRSGLREMRGDVLRWRVGRGWWLLALTAPLSIACVLWIFSFFAAAYVPRLVTESDPQALLQYVAVSALLTGAFEELGWAGFATPAILPRYGVVRTGLIIGLLTAVWNLPIVYLKEISVPTPGALPLWVFLAVSLVTWQTAYRVLLVFAYDRTRSVLLAMVMQTSLVAAWTALTPLGLTQPMVMLFYIALTAVWCAVGVALLVRSRRSGADRAVPVTRATAVTG